MRAGANRPRPIRILLICIGFGAVVSLAVAWVLAATVTIPMYPRDTVRYFVADGHVWQLTQVHCFGVVDTWWMIDPTRSDDKAIPSDPESLAAALRDKARERQDRPDPANVVVSADRPIWGDMRHPTASLPTIGSDTGFGWPLPCLWYQVTGVQSKNAAGLWQVDDGPIRGAILLKGEPSSRIRGFRALPLWPALWGLLIDTLVFAALAWLVLVARPWLRARRRMRKGLCTRCGYDLVGDYRRPCPECGHSEGRFPLTDPAPSASPE